MRFLATLPLCINAFPPHILISVSIADYCWVVLIRLSNHWVACTKLSTLAWGSICSSKQIKQRLCKCNAGMPDSPQNMVLTAFWGLCAVRRVHQEGGNFFVFLAFIPTYPLQSLALTEIFLISFQLIITQMTDTTCQCHQQGIVNFVTANISFEPRVTLEEDIDHSKTPPSGLSAPMITHIYAALQSISPASQKHVCDTLTNTLKYTPSTDVILTPKLLFSVTDESDPYFQHWLWHTSVYKVSCQERFSYPFISFHHFCNKYSTYKWSFYPSENCH